MPEYSDIVSGYDTATGTYVFVRGRRALWMKVIDVLANEFEFDDDLDIRRRG